MCGRFNLVMPDLEELRQYLPIDRVDVEAWAPRYNIAPTQRSPVLRLREDGKNTLELLQWGLVPHDATAIGSIRPINARVEGLTRRRMFRGLLGTRHCIVPATGYYEWQRGEGAKQPWVIAPAAGILAMAGLWDRWVSRDGTVVDTFAVITRPPQPEIAFIHDRMPLLLESPASAAWIAGDGSVLSMGMGDRHALVATPISRLVNRPANDTPEVLTPTALPAPSVGQLALNFKPKLPGS